MDIYRQTYILILIFSLSPVFLNAQNNGTFTVVIDPGHGGKDPGAVHKQFREKDIVLSIGLKLGQYIKKNLSDVNVIYTRSTDKFVPLHRRAEIANKNKADLFISLHANYFRSSSISGTETFVLGLHKNDANKAVAEKENSVIQFEDDFSSHYKGYDPSDPILSEIIFSTIQSEYSKQSIEFAAKIQDQFRDRAGRKDRSVKQAGFLVLWQTGMPSVLVEVGFLSNPSEARYMASEKGQAILASAIFRAVREYKNNVEDKSDFKLLANEEISETPSKTKKAESINVEGIYFSVQLIASSAKINTSADNFSGLTPVYRKSSGSLFKYFYGKERSFDKINQLKMKAKSKFPDAFIVAFENEKPISVKKAMKKLGI